MEGKHFHHSKSKGFTLIELVIVIVLLGILAATALPKFANLTGQAYLAATRGVAGGLGDAVNIAYAQWLASGQQNAVFTLQDGTQIGPSTTGWPSDAQCNGCGGTVTAGTNTANPARCQAVLANILQNPPQIIGSGSVNVKCPNAGVGTCPAAGSSGTNFLNSSTSTGTQCIFVDPVGNTIRYDVTSGLVISP